MTSHITFASRPFVHSFVRSFGSVRFDRSVRFGVGHRRTSSIANTLSISLYVVRCVRPFAPSVPFRSVPFSQSIDRSIDRSFVRSRSISLPDSPIPFILSLYRATPSSAARRSLPSIACGDGFIPPRLWRYQWLCRSGVRRWSYVRVTTSINQSMNQSMNQSIDRSKAAKQSAIAIAIVNRNRSPIMTFDGFSGVGVR